MSGQPSEHVNPPPLIEIIRTERVMVRHRAIVITVIFLTFLLVSSDYIYAMLDSGRIQFMTSMMKYSKSQPPTSTDGIAIATRGFSTTDIWEIFQIVFI